jgi:hypothetical protein
MASIGTSTFIAQNTNYEDLTFGFDGAAAVGTVQVQFDEAAPKADVIASLKRARDLVNQYMNNR